MSEPKRGLGRGLSALLGEVEREQPIASRAGRDEVQLLPVGRIVAHPDQPRRRFDEAALDELGRSIAARGLIQPIMVRPLPGGSYQIVAGERRWRAAQRAHLHEIPAVVRELDDAATLEIALVENMQRQDLNAIEEAEGLSRLLHDYGHTQQELGELVHKSRSHVTNLLRLLELPQAVRDHVASGALSMGHARALVTAADPASLAEEAIRRGLSVRETEKLARGARPPRRARVDPVLDIVGADLAALERQLGDLLGLPVTIRHSGSHGNVTLAYSSLDQLDMICQRLTGEAI